MNFPDLYHLQPGAGEQWLQVVDSEHYSISLDPWLSFRRAGSMLWSGIYLSCDQSLSYIIIGRIAILSVSLGLF